jgi:hypothetical protein
MLAGKVEKKMLVFRNKAKLSRKKGIIAFSSVAIKSTIKRA